MQTIRIRCSTHRPDGRPVKMDYKLREVEDIERAMLRVVRTRSQHMADLELFLGCEIVAEDVLGRRLASGVVEREWGVCRIDNFKATSPPGTGSAG